MVSALLRVPERPTYRLASPIYHIIRTHYPISSSSLCRAKGESAFFCGGVFFFVRAGESLLSVPLNVGASEPVDDLCVSLYLHLD